MKLNPYLNFDGNCREAFEFYQKCLGGEMEVLTYGDMPADENPDAPEGCAPPEAMAECADLVAHVCLTFGDAVLMASDCPPGFYEAPAGTVCSLQIPDPVEGKAVFERLSEGGMVKMPFGPTVWAKGFGMFNDKFGIPWMVNCEGTSD